MSQYHAVVWMDHAEAHVLEFAGKVTERKRVRNANAQHLHHKAGVIGAGKGGIDAGYCKEVIEAVGSAAEILVVGPGNAKLEFIRYLHKHAPLVEAKIVGVETADHPTDGQLLAHARARFDAIDRMRPQL
jgi:stalled ribosome rescue protein Dom34